MRLLTKNGYEVFHSFLTKKEMNILTKEILQYIAQNKVYDIPVDKLNTFSKMRTQTSTIINKRYKDRDGDEGLIDIYNIDSSLSTESNVIINKIKEYNLKILNEEFPDINYQFFTNNLYINKSVKNTRGIHADSDEIPSRYKSFLFITDVPDESYGPFSYIAKTHLGEGKSYHKKYNIYKPLTKEHTNNYKIFTGIKKGDMLTASVAGAHRGLPQTEGRLRIVLVSSYDPKGHKM